MFADAASMQADAGRRPMLALLAAWCERGWLRPLDRALARFLWHEVPEAEPLLILAAALASHQLGRGHACLDLAATLADPAMALSLPPDEDDAGDTPTPAALLAGLDLAGWLAALDCPALVGDGDGDAPLVLDGGRLYLKRYWRYEQTVRAGIEQRLARSVELAAALRCEALRESLDRLFPSAGAIDWQRIACALAARSAFGVITGGPGTGKTTTVVRLLAVLQSLALGAGPRALRIRLAAPTGKAAARLNATIAGAVAELPVSEAIRGTIPVEVATLHRLLGSRPDTRRFRHHAGNPLALDVLVIDEASMVDLEMMAAVLEALPAAARLLLIGDKDQLASVEAGAVLGQLCRDAQRARYTPATVEWLAGTGGERVGDEFVDAAGSALDQAVAMLRVSRRFDASSAIGRLAAAVNAGDLAAAEAALAVAGALQRLGPTEAAFDALVVEGFGGFLRSLREDSPGADAPQPAFDAWARAVLDAQRGFQVLCALRAGPWGVSGLNRRIAEALHAAGLIDASEGWFPGRPVLVTRNDYGLGLMNGDIGITLAGRGGVGGLRVAFPAADGGGGIRWVLPSRLTEVETVFALTVHKSQGSEFGHVVLCLPANPSPILTRELLYTGITRAKRRLTLVEPGGQAVLGAAIARRVLRAGRLSLA